MSNSIIPSKHLTHKLEYLIAGNRLDVNDAQVCACVIAAHHNSIAIGSSFINLAHAIWTKHYPNDPIAD